jgi:molybdenum cofactor sulfurtransferase
MCASVVESFPGQKQLNDNFISGEKGGMASALADFRRRYPEYDHEAVESLRLSEYGRLDELAQIYLDYTGGGLHGSSQLNRHFEMLSTTVLGNPHSHNPTSLAMTERVEGARAYVLHYFNASPDEYVAIFTSNASGALKHVGESYPFDADSRFLISYDNHNSVNGIREFARSKDAAITYVPVQSPDLRIDRDVLRVELTHVRPDGNHLFAFPAQSNFSGVQYPLELIEEAQDAGLGCPA